VRTRLAGSIGQGSPFTGYSLAPDTVAGILRRTATDHPCPPGGVVSYARVGRSTAWDAACTGDAHDNSIWGDGIVNAARAVQ